MTTKSVESETVVARASRRCVADLLLQNRTGETPGPRFVQKSHAKLQKPVNASGVRLVYAAQRY